MAKSKKNAGSDLTSGKNGNAPGDVDMQEAAKLHTQAALDTLLWAAKQRKSPSVAVTAAIAILDRGWGKPAQVVSGPDGKPIGDGKIEVTVRLVKPEPKAVSGTTLRVFPAPVTEGTS